MSGWASKRFWKAASVDEAEGGYTVTLDGRPVRTPLKKTLLLPTARFAEAVAAEWDAQEEQIDPTTMPFTRAANAALDKVSAQRDEVRQMLADYAGTDLLCYRATDPEALIARQAEAWDTLLDWAAERYGAPLTVTAGVIPVDQPADSLEAYRAEVAWFSDFELTGFHDLVAISGSLILAFAVVEDRISAENAYEVSRIDELWQIEQWGDDAEASALTKLKRGDFLRAREVMQMSQPDF